ncbi:unnamed protein product [Phaeothamnion confervicola]
MIWPNGCQTSTAKWMPNYYGKQALDAETAYYKRQWKKADADGSGTLDTGEVIQLVQKLNINTDRAYIKAKIAQVDDNNDKVLQFDEFVELMRLLRARDEIEALFLALLAGTIFEGDAKGGGLALPKLTAEEQKRIRSEHLPAEVFRRFLREEQGQSLEEDKVTALLLELDPEGEGKVLCYRAFYSYMAGAANEAYNPARTKEPYQNMDHPLSHYFVASSHNTYLEGDQLQSASSVNRYINDLCKGCRCVEIDCWDGEDGEPVVFHGHTLTGKIRFKDVVDAVKEYSFLNSQYPVILSLENHCSLPQQDIMAKYMAEVFGDLLQVPPAEMETLPSPESLMNKIILKGKIVKDADQFVADDDDSDDELVETLEEAGPSVEAAAAAEANAAYTAAYEGGGGGDDGLVPVREEGVAGALEGDNEAAKKAAAAVVARRASAADGGAGAGAAAGTDGGSEGAAGEKRPGHVRRRSGACSARGSVGSQGSVGSISSLKGGSSFNFGSGGGSSVGGSSKKEKKVHKVSLELSRITFLGGAKFKGWEAAALNTVNGMSSFGESKTAKLIAKAAAPWVRYNQRQMSRIYPAGARVDSSNYDPVPSWNVGSQIVALNYQTPGAPMRHNDGKFRDNGGCGYVLKPWFLRDPDTTFAPDAPFGETATLVIRVISAQQLPKPGGAERGEIIDPYVQLSLSGLPADTTRKARSTRTIDDNGFNPYWDERFEFQVSALHHRPEEGEMLGPCWSTGFRFLKALDLSLVHSALAHGELQMFPFLFSFHCNLAVHGGSGGASAAEYDGDGQGRRCGRLHRLRRDPAALPSPRLPQRRPFQRQRHALWRI